MDNENLEIKSALQTIDLLKQYKSAKTQTEKDGILKQMDDIDGFANRLLTKFSPDELITKITKAISLDQYRPKNLPITLFAVNKDLNYVNGEFDTFDKELSQMFKNNENPENIRDKFTAGTVNVYKLAEQFSADWIRKLNNHKDLVDAARNAGEENIIDAYNKLFYALTKDFCKEHDCHIDSRVITDWENSDIKPNGGYDITDGFHNHAFSVAYPQNISETEKKELVDNFLKDPEKHPNAYKSSFVRVNITNVKKHHPDKNDFFYSMISVLAHEIHHALDYQKPRKGALGPQIQYIDHATYVPAHIDDKAYHESATEISSYKIDHELFNQLKKLRF
jgi:hypothetical protein